MSTNNYYFTVRKILFSPQLHIFHRASFHKCTYQNSLICTNTKYLDPSRHSYLNSFWDPERLASV